jgi:cyclopropane-fatty-acyl-phospholipid synthase
MYPFETAGGDNWMGRHFFTGGLMPATDTLLWFQRDLQVEQQWQLDGTHYQRTANDWLRNQDHHQDAVMEVLRRFYGDTDARLWYQRWRMFWMACAETFGYERGQEWVVAHYRLTQQD